MNLRYFGHSCFLLTSDDKTRILCDPYGDIGYPLPAVDCDAVTVSHAHYDHANLGGVPCQSVLPPQGGKVGGITVRAEPSFHDEAGGAKRGGNIIYFFEADGVCVAHLGDLGEPVGEKRLASLRGADVLLIPVGGNYTIDAKTAAAYVDALRPAYVIPMHYKTAKLKIDIEGVEPFLRSVSCYPIRRVGSEFRPDRTHGGTQIIVMERAQ